MGMSVFELIAESAKDGDAGRPSHGTQYTAASIVKEADEFGDRLDPWRAIVLQTQDACLSAFTADNIEKVFVDRPPLTGSAIADAGLAALAEYHAHQCQFEVPPWTQEAERYIEEPVYVAHTPYLRLLADADSVPEFAAHGIIIEHHSLDRA